MADEDPTARPLPGDRRRQAVASLRGYDYQIWRTIEAWLQLKNGETLFLECAEDFDTVQSDGTATATQVKDSQTPLSLSSSDALDAIANYIDLKSRTPSPVTFAFITRGRIAQERGLETEPGISLWRKAAAGDETAASKVRTYLLGVLDQRSGAKTFLNTRGPLELIRDLFQNMYWLTDEPDSSLVQQSVRSYLIYYGEKLGRPATASAGVMNSLHAYCWEVILRSQPSERRLTRADFLYHFDMATSVRVPLRDTVLNALAGQVIQGSGQVSPLLLEIGPVYWIEGTPPLPDPVLPREATINDVLRGLSEGKPALLAGSAGKGKTTAAKLIASRSARPCLWMQLSGRTNDFTERAMNAAAIEIQAVRSKRLIVVDDLPSEPGVTQPIWTALELLHRATVLTGSSLVLTTRALPRERVDSRLTLDWLECLDRAGLH